MNSNFKKEPEKLSEEDFHNVAGEKILEILSSEEFGNAAEKFGEWAREEDSKLDDNQREQLNIDTMNAMLEYFFRVGTFDTLYTYEEIMRYGWDLSCLKKEDVVDDKK